MFYLHVLTYCKDQIKKHYIIRHYSASLDEQLCQQLNILLSVTLSTTKVFILHIHIIFCYIILYLASFSDPACRLNKIRL